MEEKKQAAFLFKVKKNSLGKNSLAIISNLKYSTKAVERNRIKRQIRGFFSLNRSKILSGFDFLFVLRKKSKTEDEILQEVKKTIKEGGYLE